MSLSLDYTESDSKVGLGLRQSPGPTFEVVWVLIENRPKYTERDSEIGPGLRQSSGPTFETRSV